MQVRVGGGVEVTSAAAAAADVATVAAAAAVAIFAVAVAVTAVTGASAVAAALLLPGGWLVVVAGVLCVCVASVTVAKGGGRA